MPAPSALRENASRGGEECEHAGYEQDFFHIYFFRLLQDFTE
jgi:hypothetical protein